MAKNIIVVDEQGNEYEATYPKRAKGLVKNGRARFVAENKICLVCPPEDILEDNEMSDKLNKQQILTQIIKLQESMESLRDPLYSLQCISDAQTCVENDDGEHTVLDYMPEVALEKVKALQTIVLKREETLNKMLDFYLTVYRQLDNAEIKE